MCVSVIMRQEAKVTKTSVGMGFKTFKYPQGAWERSLCLLEGGGGT